jgi:UPF0042 nucleotide-binding protein
MLVHDSAHIKNGMASEDRATISELESTKTFTAEIMSFGFKYGVPAGDIVIDVRFIPNPFYVDALRPLCGLDPACSAYVLGSEHASATIDALTGLASTMIPIYMALGRSPLRIMIGCTGGQHRSVAMAEALGTTLVRLGHVCSIRHREMEDGRYPFTPFPMNLT